MYHVNWTTVVTDNTLTSLHKAAGVKSDVCSVRMREILAAILSQCGGLPVTTRDWSEVECTTICLKLLHEATGAVLRRGLGLVPQLPGCDFKPSNNSALHRKLVTVQRVDINVADDAELEPLPVLGPSLSNSVVRERRSKGPFLSNTDLAQRINGIGESAVHRLGLVLHYGNPGKSPSTSDKSVYSGIFDKDFRSLVELQTEKTADQKLMGALETLASFTAAAPHPATQANRMREDLLASPDIPVQRFPVDSAEILEDEAYYYRMQTLLDSANKRIDVAMFFLAFPGTKHPSRVLLEKLVDAHKKGADVRVLVDKDREDDPYGSRIINQNAIAFLREHGVAARTDRVDQLLHSKFVVIDGSVSVIGSHNWTAGSYFKYHDTSIALQSSHFACAMHQRFDAMWKQTV